MNGRGLKRVVDTDVMCIRKKLKLSEGVVIEDPDGVLGEPHLDVIDTGELILVKPEQSDRDFELRANTGGGLLIDEGTGEVILDAQTELCLTTGAGNPSLLIEAATNSIQVRGTGPVQLRVGHVHANTGGSLVVGNDGFSEVIPYSYAEFKEAGDVDIKAGAGDINLLPVSGQVVVDSDLTITGSIVGDRTVILDNLKTAWSVGQFVEGKDLDSIVISTLTDEEGLAIGGNLDLIRTNLKERVVSIRGMLSNTDVLTNQITSASTELNVTTEPWQAFDGSISTSWVAKQDNYDGVTGVYDGDNTGVKTTLVSGLNVDGEWIQMQFPSGTGYSISKVAWANASGGESGAREITIAGSTNGTTWFTVKQINVQWPTGGETSIDFVVGTAVNADVYSHIRIIVEKMGTPEDFTINTFLQTNNITLYAFEDAATILVPSTGTTSGYMFAVDEDTGLHMEGDALALSVDGTIAMKLYPEIMIMNNVQVDVRASSFMQYHMEENGGLSMLNVTENTGVDPVGDYFPVNDGLATVDGSAVFNADVLVTNSSPDFADWRTRLIRAEGFTDYFRITYDITIQAIQAQTFTIFVSDDVDTDGKTGTVKYPQSVTTFKGVVGQPINISKTFYIDNPYDQDASFAWRRFSLRALCEDNAVSDLTIWGYSVLMERMPSSK